MKLKLFVLIIAVMITMGSCARSMSDLSESDRVPVKFGLMKKDTNGYYRITSETRTIPLITDDPNYRFGFEVEHQERGNFTGHVIMHFPSIAARTTVTFGRDHSKLGYSERDEGRVVQTAPVKYDKYWLGDINFDKGDPEGKYRLDIYENDKLIESVEFFVVSP